VKSRLLLGELAFFTIPFVVRPDIAACTAAGEAAGLLCRYSVATPAVWGVAIDVPLIVLVDVWVSHQSDVMFTPGANQSMHDPKSENEARVSVLSVAPMIIAAVRVQRAVGAPAQAHVRDGRLSCLVVTGHPVHARDDPGREAGAGAGEHPHADEGDGLSDPVGRPADGARYVSAVAVAVGGWPARDDRVVTRSGAR